MKNNLQNRGKPFDTISQKRSRDAIRTTCRAWGSSFVDLKIIELERVISVRNRLSSRVVDIYISQ